MSRRGETEDGLGWGGLVASKAELRAEKEHDAELTRLRAQNEALKRDLQYARDGLTKGRTRMREDNERLRSENAALKLEAHAWSKAAEHYAKPRQPLDPLEVEELWDKANEEWGASLTDAAEPFRGEDAFQHFARLIERKHGIGA